MKRSLSYANSDLHLPSNKRFRWWKEIVSKVEGFSHNDAKSLIAAGYVSADKTASTSKEMLLTTVPQMNLTKVDSLLTEAYRHVPISSVVDASTISTGCIVLDGYIGGGIKKGVLTEVTGESGTGKTQLCHTLLVTSMIQTGPNVGRKCMYIDTYKTFRTERIIDIADRFGLEPFTVLENVTHGRATNTDHLESLLNEAYRLFRKSSYCLLIVDSATNLFRSEYDSNVGAEMRDRQKIIMRRVVRFLRKIAVDYQIDVVLTNEIRADFGMFSSLTNPLGGVPIGGRAVSDYITTRLYLIKKESGVRVCKISNLESIAECHHRVLFEITTGGIEDIKT